MAHNINNKKTIKNLFPNAIERYREVKQFSNIYGSEKTDVWDQHWALAIIINDGKVILPEANLCRHLGFDSGTHYSKHPGSVARFSGYIDFGKITLPFRTPG